MAWGWEFKRLCDWTIGKILDFLEQGACNTFKLDGLELENARAQQSLN